MCFCCSAALYNKVDIMTFLHEEVRMHWRLQLISNDSDKILVSYNYSLLIKCIANIFIIIHPELFCEDTVAVTLKTSYHNWNFADF